MFLVDYWRFVRLRGWFTGGQIRYVLLGVLVLVVVDYLTESPALGFLAVFLAVVFVPVALALLARLLDPIRTLQAKAVNALVLGDPDKATVLLDQAIAKANKAWTEDHPFHGYLWTAKSDACNMKGDYVQAQEWAEKALEHQERTWGPSSYMVIPFLSTLASVCTANAEYVHALKLLERARDIYESPQTGLVAWLWKRMVERHHPGINNALRAVILHNEARIYRLRKESGEAASLFREALNWYGDNPKTIPQRTHRWLCLLELARTYVKMGNLAAAEDLYDELDSRLGDVGPVRHRLDGALEALEAEMLLAKGKPDKALPLALLGLEKAMKGTPNLHVRFIEYHHIVAEAAQKLGDWELAETHARKALELCKEYKAPGDALVADCLETFGNILVRTGRLDDGNDYLTKVKNIRSKHA